MIHAKSVPLIQLGFKDSILQAHESAELALERNFQPLVLVAQRRKLKQSMNSLVLEHRQGFARHSVSASISVCTMDAATWKCSLIDIGPGGLAFETRIVPALGDALVLSFKLPGYNLLTVVLTQVVYVMPIDRHRSHRVGVQFGRLSGDVKDVIGRIAEA